MPVAKIILIALGGALALGLIGGKIVSSILKNRAKPGYKRLLSTKESILCTLSAVLGVALIVVGVFVLPTLNQPEEAVDPEDAESLNSEIDAESSSSSSGGGGGSVVVTERGGGGVVVMGRYTTL